MEQQLACPHCTQTVSVLASLSGQAVACPHCSGTFTVPAFVAGEHAVPQVEHRPKPPLTPSKTAAGTGEKPRPTYLLAGAVLLGAFFVPLSLYLVIMVATALFRGPAADGKPVEVATTIGVAEPEPLAPAGAVVSPPAVHPSMTQPAARTDAAPITRPANTQPALPPAPTRTAPPVMTPAPPPQTGGAVAASAADNRVASATNGSPVLPQVDHLEATDLVDRVEPSVVIVDIGDSLGSGFIYDTQGTIVTNYHVIEGAKKAQIKFADKTTAEVAGFLAIAPGKDLALLRINPAGHVLQPLRVATARPHKGESVLAFGAPRGLGSTVSDGIVSSLRLGTELRDVFKQMTGVDVYTEHQRYDLDAWWIQTTAPISGGNSGGPLVNARGEVVGLNTWHRTDGQNLNFAISAEHIARMMNAQSGVQPLANLPPPREPTLAAGMPKRTLEYWEEASRINRALAGRIKKLKQPPIPDDRERLIAMFPKISGTCKKLGDMMPEAAAKLKALQIDDVDEELVRLVTVDALTMEKIGENLRDLAVDIKLMKKVVAPLDTEILAKKAYGKFNDIELGPAYDVMRINLTNRYGLTFSSLLSDGPRAKSAKADEAASSSGEPATAETGESAADAEREKKARSKLKLAKQLLESGKTESVKQRLQKIIEEFGGTKAANEAERLLNEW